MSSKNIIRAADRFRARHDRERAALDASFAEISRHVPRAHILAVFEAVTTNSEEPLYRLPSPERERMISTFRQAARNVAARKTISAEIVVLGAAARTQPA